jgi:uncharacterized iron-regulated membrane protein
MNANTVKTFLSIHTWTGLGAGMALFIAFYAGAMTVFFHELEVWDDFDGVAEVRAHNLSDSQRLLDLAVTENPNMDTNLRVYPPDADHPQTSVLWFERLDDGTFERHDFRFDESKNLDTSEPLEGNLASLVYRLHYTAGLPNNFGTYVLGLVSLIYGLALVTGLLVFLPNLMKDLLNVRPGKNKKRFWLDSHNAVGVISFPWHMMFAWSSVILTIAIFLIAPFQLMVYEDDLIEMIGPELGVVTPIEATGESAAVLPLEELLAIAEREAPGMSASQLRFTNYGDENTMVQIFGDSNTQTLLTNASITLNGTSGEVLGVSHPSTSGIGATFYSGLIALHYVTYGGFLVKWLYFIMGLAGAFLFFSGNLLWIETRRKRRSRDQPSNTLFLARLNSGVCIGCMLGISGAFLVSRALMGMEGRGDWTEVAYYALFFGSLAWCYLRPVALASRDLLFGCAALTALIPVFDGVFANMPIWQSLSAGNWPMFCVSLIALIGAVLFLRIGLTVHKRAYFGNPNSVWAADAVKTEQTATIGVETAQAAGHG